MYKKKEKNEAKNIILQNIYPVTHSCLTLFSIY